MDDTKPPPHSIYRTSHAPIIQENPTNPKALIELFDFLLYLSPFQTEDSVTLDTDSQYALSLLMGSSIPATHHQLFVFAQHYFTALRCCYKVKILKVPSHEGIPGNDLADRFANRGVTSFDSLGRFFSSPSAPLRPPEVGFNQQSWSSLSTASQGDSPPSMDYRSPHSRLPNANFYRIFVLLETPLKNRPDGTRNYSSPKISKTTFTAALFVRRQLDCIIYKRNEYPLLNGLPLLQITSASGAQKKTPLSRYMLLSRRFQK